jgi:hypothetical protein
MNAIRIWFAASVAVELAGCSVGPSPSTYGPARDPAGTTCTISLRSSQRLAGELLAARASDAVMVVGGKITAISYGSIAESRCEGVGAIPFDGSGTLVEAWAGELRGRARYPQAIGEELMARLLRAYGQTELLRW